jgi:hypothetical protein
MENTILLAVWASVYENYIVVEPNFFNFESRHCILDLQWLLQHFHRCISYYSLVCHIYFQFSFFFHYIPHSSFKKLWQILELPYGYGILEACSQPTTVEYGPLLAR